MRRGLIFVNSGVRNYCCNNMIAGTVIIKKDIGKKFWSWDEKRNGPDK